MLARTFPLEFRSKTTMWSPEFLEEPAPAARAIDTPHAWRGRWFRTPRPSPAEIRRSRYPPPAIPPLPVEMPGLISTKNAATGAERPADAKREPPQSRRPLPTLHRPAVHDCPAT